MFHRDFRINSNIKKALPIVIIISLFGNVLPAQNRWSVGLKPGIGIQFYDRQATKSETLPDSLWGPYQGPFYTSYVNYRAGLSVDYEAANYLKLGITTYLSQRISNTGSGGGTAKLGQSDGSLVTIERKSSFQVTEWGIVPTLSLDGLFKNNDKALSLQIALNLGLRSQFHRHIEEVDTSSIIYREFINTRSGFFIAGIVGLEWEEYFTDHFGYSIGVQYQFPAQFKPRKLNIESYIHNYEEKTADEGEYTYSTTQEEQRIGKTLRQETFFFQNAFIELGIRYRF